MIGTRTTQKRAMTSLSFCTGLLVADIVIDDSLPGEGSIETALICFGIAALAGALKQLYEYSEREEESTRKKLKVCAGAFCGCALSGVAGFVAYGFTRNFITDPILLGIEATLAGWVGVKFVQHEAEAWLRRRLGNDND